MENKTAYFLFFKEYYMICMIICMGPIIWCHEKSFSFLSYLIIASIFSISFGTSLESTS